MIRWTELTLLFWLLLTGFTVSELKAIEQTMGRLATQALKKGYPSLSNFNSRLESDR